MMEKYLLKFTFLLCVFLGVSSVSLAWMPPTKLKLEVKMLAKEFLHGREIMCEVLATNEGDRPVIFINAFALDDKHAGYRLELRYEGEPLPGLSRYGTSTSGGWLEPGLISSMSVDLNVMFGILSPGEYEIRTTYQRLVKHPEPVADAENQNPYDEVTVFGPSEWVKFRVVEDNETKNAIAKYRRVLEADNSRRLLAALRKLPNEPNRVVIPLFDSVIDLALNGENEIVKNEAVMFLLKSYLDNNLDKRKLTKKISERHLCELIELGAKSKLMELREVAAECRASGRRQLLLWSNSFSVQKWFEREESAKARLSLLRIFDGREAAEFLADTSLKDPSPEVRIGAFRRLEYVLTYYKHEHFQFTPIAEKVLRDNAKISLNFAIRLIGEHSNIQLNHDGANTTVSEVARVILDKRKKALDKNE